MNTCAMNLGHKKGTEIFAKDVARALCTRTGEHLQQEMAIAVEHGLQWEYAMMLSQDSRNELTGPELCSSSCHLEKTNTFLWSSAK